MPIRRIVLFVALTLATVGGASTLAVGAPQPATSLSSGDSTVTTARLDDQLPELELGDGTTTTSSVPATSTTVAPGATSTTATPPTTVALTHPPTTVPPPTTSTIPPNVAWIRFVNQFTRAVNVEITDETQNIWTFGPGDEAGTFTIATSSEHGDGANVSDATNPQCGNGDGEDYFKGGHEYKIWIGTDTQGCPMLTINDLTAGTSRNIGQPGMPRTG